MKNSRMTYKNLGLALLSATFFTFSCTKDEDDINSNGQLVLNFSSNTTNIPGSSSSTRTTNGNSTIEITDFLINIKEFELELDIEDTDDDNELWDDNGSFDYEDEIELTGPFELDLMTNQFSVVSVEIPNGIYEEIKFIGGRLAVELLQTEQLDKVNIINLKIVELRTQMELTNPNIADTQQVKQGGINLNFYKQMRKAFQVKLEM